MTFSYGFIFAEYGYFVDDFAFPVRLSKSDEVLFSLSLLLDDVNPTYGASFLFVQIWCCLLDILLEWGARGWIFLFKIMRPRRALPSLHASLRSRGGLWLCSEVGKYYGYGSDMAMSIKLWLCQFFFWKRIRCDLNDHSEFVLLLL
jgi:hypothetical protein